MVVGDDLVLFEVHARRVSGHAAVTGDAAKATLEVSRLILAFFTAGEDNPAHSVEKVDQLGPSIGALLTGDAVLPGVDIDNIKRIWPVVVSVGHVMQTQNLWSYVRAEMDAMKAAPLSDSRVQPLQLFDIEDDEKLMGLIEDGESLTAILARKSGGAFRDRDFAAWLHGDPSSPSDKPRLSLLQRRWAELGDRVTSLIRLAAEATADEGED